MPTYFRKGRFRKVYGAGPATLTTHADRTLPMSLAGLSTAVYVSDDRIPRSHAAPQIRLAEPEPAAVSHGRMHVAADVHGDSFYEVTFQRKVGHGSWQTIGVDDSAPYQVFDDVSSLTPGREVSYRAAVLDNAGHTRGSASRSAQVPRTEVTMTKPTDGGTVSRIDPVALTAAVDPERPLQSVEFQRSVNGGPWTSLGTDSSAPAYTATDDVSGLPLGTAVRYRAILSEHGSVQDTSAPVSVTTAPPQPAVGSVTVAGSLQSELACPDDWLPNCAATHLAFDTSDGKWHRTFTLPAGSYEWKVAINDSWDVNYGAGGAAGGSNLVLSVPAGGGSYVFTWDQVTHVPSVAPAGLVRVRNGPPGHRSRRAVERHGLSRRAGQVGLDHPAYDVLEGHGRRPSEVGPDPGGVAGEGLRVDRAEAAPGRRRRTTPSRRCRRSGTPWRRTPPPSGSRRWRPRSRAATSARAARTIASTKSGAQPQSRTAARLPRVSREAVPAEIAATPAVILRVTNCSGRRGDSWL